MEEHVFMSIDSTILLWIQENVRSPWLDQWMLFLSNTAWMLVLIPLGLLLFKKTRKAGFYLLASYILCLVLSSYIIKPLVMRVRPFLAVAGLERIGNIPGGSSFPSSHTTSVFSIAFMLVWLKKKVWWIPSFIYASAVAFSRLYLGVHYPTDVVGGILTALIGSWIVFKVGSWIEKKTKSSH